jgi:signal transduction histidine kinase
MLDDLGQYRRAVRAKEHIRGLLLEKIVRVQEEERKKVSRELHDQLGPSLSALLLEIQADPPSCGSCERGSALTTRIRQLIDEVHQLAWELRPSILDDYGLDSALQRYIDETSKKSSISVDYQHISPPKVERLPGWIELVLYRIAQEAITNVLRHSGANRASVILMRKRRNIMLLVEDDGCGFSLPVTRNGNNGLGLIGMKERVDLCGGSWTAVSAEGCGTTIRVSIPLEEALK